MHTITKHSDILFEYKGIRFKSHDTKFIVFNGPLTVADPMPKYENGPLRRFSWREIIDHIDSLEQEAPKKFSTIMNTFSGKEVDVLNPTPDMFCIEDIAHAQSNMCRFGGHTFPFYSVAEHSVSGLQFIKNPVNKKAFLMHDATEAIIGDIIRPLKHLLTEYERIEHNMSFVIAEAFGFQYPFDDEIKEVDDYMLKLELEHFVYKTHDHWEKPIWCFTPDIAKARFLRAYNELK